MKIRLNEIPDEGRSYIFDRKSGELNAELKDVLGSNEYEVAMFIKPIGNAYEMRGGIRTHLAEVCSKCGYDFDLKVDRKFNEIIFEEQNDEHRKSQSVHGNQSVNFLGEGPAMVPVRGNIFDAGRFANEAIILEEPFYPTCGPNGSCLRAAEVEEVISRLAAEADFGEEEIVGKSPFAALKDLELSRKN